MLKKTAIPDPTIFVSFNKSITQASLDEAKAYIRGKGQTQGLILTLFILLKVCFSPIIHFKNMSHPFLIAFDNSTL